MKKFDWVAFVFDGHNEESYTANNRCFKKAADADNKTEEVGDWWRFDGEDTVFFLLKCAKEEKDALGDRLSQEDAIVDGETFLDYYLRQWTTDSGGKDKGLVFLHWHSDWESSKDKTEKLQKLLRKQFPALEVRCISSEMPSTKYGQVFDLGKPIVPVADFGRWFDMFERYYNNGPQSITGYTQDTYPNHKGLGATSGPKRMQCEGGSDMSGNNSGVHAVPLPSQSSQGRASISHKERTTTKIATGFSDLNPLITSILRVAVGLMAGCLALEPLTAIKRYLSVETFNTLPPKGKLAMLAFIFLSAVFATCTWGILAYAMTRTTMKKD